MIVDDCRESSSLSRRRRRRRRSGIETRSDEDRSVRLRRQFSTEGLFLVDPTSWNVYVIFIGCSAGQQRSPRAAISMINRDRTIRAFDTGEMVSRLSGQVIKSNEHGFRKVERNREKAGKAFEENVKARGRERESRTLLRRISLSSNPILRSNSPTTRLVSSRVSFYPWRSLREERNCKTLGIVLFDER